MVKKKKKKTLLDGTILAESGEFLSSFVACQSRTKMFLYSGQNNPNSRSEVLTHAGSLVSPSEGTSDFGAGPELLQFQGR
mmetsp:Transcript_22124/g.48360  ORF Transcript_22124/g.48360 Transcript_22124/m.48360 type:complete len:80 (+) Transcript_22124:395-634(+)